MVTIRYVTLEDKKIRFENGGFSMGNTVRKVTLILLVLSVVFSLASCKKVEADYIFQIKNSDKSYSYSISNDTLEKISTVQYNTALNYGNSYSSCKYEVGIVNISAKSSDPAEWEYSDEDNVPLDPELKQLWAGRMKSVELPFTGSFDVMFYTFDDYIIACASKYDTKEMQYVQTEAVFHNDKLIGTITDLGTLSGLCKHN